jgi:putative PIN family toxin of toxin-antitoxin system
VIPRIVLDTNIYVSALRYGGKPKQVLDHVLYGEFQLLISAPLKMELERVLRDRFSYLPCEIVATTAFLWCRAELVMPSRHLDLCPDETDNRVLECAIEGKAGFIVTGDKHLLNLPPIEALAILSPNLFLDWLLASGATT